MHLQVNTIHRAHMADRAFEKPALDGKVLFQIMYFQ
jgi:hypothetical protein